MLENTQGGRIRNENCKASSREAGDVILSQELRGWWTAEITRPQESDPFQDS